MNQCLTCRHGVLQLVLQDVGPFEPQRGVVWVASQRLGVSAARLLDIAGQYRTARPIEERVHRRPDGGKLTLDDHSELSGLDTLRSLGGDGGEFAYRFGTLAVPVQHMRQLETQSVIVGIAIQQVTIDRSGAPVLFRPRQRLGVLDVQRRVVGGRYEQRVVLSEGAPGAAAVAE